MKEIVRRLTADMRWRLSRAGSTHRPGAKERLAWTGLSIPWYIPPLAWLAWLIFCTQAAEVFSPLLSEWAILLLFGPASVIGMFPLLFWLRSALQRSSELRGYQRLLERNERFMLVEYHKYLRRYIARAQQDPTLGGPAEIRRVNELLARLGQVLASGKFDDGRQTASTLLHEAEIAEAVVETYEDYSRSELDRLDQRLSGELRQRVLDLEQELGSFERGRGRQAE